jgi:hypothetical protein
MDDLQMLAGALAAPELSREAVDRGRHRLLNRMRGPVARSRRPRVLAAALGLTAAATAAAVVVTTSGTTAPGASPNSPPPEPSGRRILLAAATTAETLPVGSGTYWHVKTVEEDKKPGSKSMRSAVDVWTRRDGRRWSGSNGIVFANDGDGSRAAFQVAFTRLTYTQLQDLPTTADGLNAWIAGSLKRSKTRRLPAGAEHTYVPRTLIALLYEFPAPPKVRAAAYRALAGLPDVKSVGVVEGGRGLLINGGTADQQELVFDPKTSLVHSVDTTGSATYHRVTVVAAEWTNTLPKTTPHKSLPPGRG